MKTEVPFFSQEVPKPEKCHISLLSPDMHSIITCTTKVQFVYSACQQET